VSERGNTMGGNIPKANNNMIDEEMIKAKSIKRIK
tara:strand:+ start:209 stop:313 length:105 start_codon:yes stop_codon:yes gene_type:complete